MKKIIKILLSLMLIFILAAAGGIFYLTRGLSAGAAVAINSVDIAGLQDGVYSGSYSAGRWDNRVEVTVQDQRIVDIDLLDDLQFSKPGVWDEVKEKVIASQSVSVDAVSGATVSSNAYLKSIEDALAN